MIKFYLGLIIISLLIAAMYIYVALTSVKIEAGYALGLFVLIVIFFFSGYIPIIEEKLNKNK